MKISYLFALLMLCALKVESQPQKVASLKSEVMQDGGNLSTAPTPFYPLYLLQKAVRTHPRTTLFRVKWDTNGSHSTNTSSLLYNKKQQTVIYQNNSQWWPDPLDTLSNPKAKGGSPQKQRLKWSRVTAPVLNRLLNEANHQSYLFKRGDLNTINDCDALIQSLTKFGARRVQS